MPFWKSGLLLAGLCLAAPAGAEPAEPTPTCAGVEDAAARLLCYDRLHGRAATPVDGARPAAEAERIREAEVVSTGAGATGRRWFRLDSGQLWQEVTPGPSDVESGDLVRISEGAFGTHHLRRSDGSSRSSQVRRLE